MFTDLNRFYEINNGLNDDLALQNAINESLETELIPPNQRFLPEFLSRYDEATLNNPVSEKACQILNTIQKCRAKLNELINMDLSTYQKVQTKSNENIDNNSTIEENNGNNRNEVLSESQLIRMQQNQEYQEALENAQEIERQRHREEEEERNNEEEAAEQHENYNKSIKEKFREIGEEPSDGLLLAVTLPDSTKITRRFAPNSLGNDVYIWVSSIDSMIESGHHFCGFNLVGPKGAIIEYDKSLHDQNIESRTMFSVLDL